MIEHGWLRRGARICESPNFNQRPPCTPIHLLVIHNISLPPGQFGCGYIHDFFQNKLDPSLDPYFKTICDMEVSAHCLIERSGEITQFVSFEHRAWHAGVSSFMGESNCNDFSIGIELEGTDDTPYTKEQYQALVCLTRLIQARYPLITKDNIVGHSDIAPQRKTDPGLAFDWQGYKSALNGSD